MSCQHPLLDLLLVLTANGEEHENDHTNEVGDPGNEPGEEPDSGQRVLGLLEERDALIGLSRHEAGGLQDEGGDRDSQGLGRLGEKRVRPEERTFPALAGAELVLIYHQGKEDVGVRLRAGHPEANENEGRRNQRCRSNHDHEKAHRPEEEIRLQGAQHPEPATHRAAHDNADDHGNEHRHQEEHGVRPDQVVRHVEDGAHGHGLHQNAKEVLRNQDQRRRAPEGEDNVLPEGEALGIAGELRPLLHAEGDDDDQRRPDDSHREHGKSKRQQRRRPSLLWSEELWNDETQAETHEPEERR